MSAARAMYADRILAIDPVPREDVRDCTDRLLEVQVAALSEPHSKRVDAGWLRWLAGMRG